MHNNGAEHGMASRCQRIGIIDAATAVGVGIGKDYEMLIGNSSQEVVELTQAERGEIAFGIKRVEMRRERSFLPIVFVGNAHATVFRWQGHSNDVEILLHVLERLIGEEALHSGGGMLVEEVGLFRTVSFSHNRHVDGLGMRAFLEIAVGRRMLAVDFTDQNVGRSHDVFE